MIFSLKLYSYRNLLSEVKIQIFKPLKISCFPDQNSLKMAMFYSFVALEIHQWMELNVNVYVRKKCLVVLKISPTYRPTYHFIEKHTFIVLVEENNSMCIALIRIINKFSLHLIVVDVESFETVLQI